MDIKDIKELITIINNTDIETLEIEKSDIRLMITKSNHNWHSSNLERTAPQETLEIKEASPVIDDQSYIIESPMVGTFYMSSSPDAAPFVKVGDKIEKGQTICIIEAMKIMNEIEAEVSGEVIEILASDEDVIEYGQALMRVRR